MPQKYKGVRSAVIVFLLGLVACGGYNIWQIEYSRKFVRGEANRDKYYAFLESQLKWGVKPDSVRFRSMTALETATAEGDIEICKLLLSYGANPKDAFLLAVRHKEIARLFLPELRMKSEKEKQELLNRALIDAVGTDVETCGLLLDAGANVNYQQEYDGETPLRKASDLFHVFTGNYRKYKVESRNIVKLLLERGASKHLKDKKRKDVVEVAQEWRDTELLELLARYP